MNVPSVNSDNIKLDGRYYLLEGRKALKRFRLDIIRIVHLETTVNLSQMEPIDGIMALSLMKKSG